MGLKRRLAGVTETAEKKRARSPGFVELVAPYAAAGAECMIEFESRTAAKMRIQWKGSGAPDWGSLLHAWREAEGWKFTRTKARQMFGCIRNNFRLS